MHIVYIFLYLILLCAVDNSLYNSPTEWLNLTGQNQVLIKSV